MESSRVADLRAFVDACKTKDPALLADPVLAFFRDYLLSLGANPPHAAKPGPKVTSMDDEDDGEDDDFDTRDPTPEPDEDIVQSDLELNGDIVKPDHDDTPQKTEDPSVEVTEECRDACPEAKGISHRSHVGNASQDAKGGASGSGALDHATTLTHLL